MPGYVMHLAEADIILEWLREKRPVSRQWEEHFLTGNLLPDTKLRKEKYISHFWNPDHHGYIAQAPDLDLFLGKYHPDIDHPVLLGYLMHLDLDAKYVHDFWPRCMKFYNSEGKPEVMSDNITEVEILKNGRRTSLKEFFSPDTYYGDYSQMNGFFVRNYHIHTPEWRDISDFQMDEVSLAKMEMISQNMKWLFEHCGPDDGPALKVFDLHELDSFIRKTAGEFVEQYLQKMI